MTLNELIDAAQDQLNDALARQESSAMAYPSRDVAFAEGVLNGLNRAKGATR